MTFLLVGYFAIGRGSVQAPVAARANVAGCKDAGHRGLPVIVGLDPAGSVQCHLLAQKSCIGLQAGVDKHCLGGQQLVHAL
jgi:hypothetical protein